MSFRKIESVERDDEKVFIFIESFLWNHPGIKTLQDLFKTSVPPYNFGLYGFNIGDFPILDIESLFTKVRVLYKLIDKCKSLQSEFGSSRAYISENFSPIFMFRDAYSQCFGEKDISNRFFLEEFTYRGFVHFDRRVQSVDEYKFLYDNISFEVHWLEVANILHKYINALRVDIQSEALSKVKVSTDLIVNPYIHEVLRRSKKK